MKNTTRTILILVALISGAGCSWAQQGELCQGDYYTEEQGAAKLAAVEARMKTVSDWKQHADSIRAQLRKGMELDILPARTPLNARSPLFDIWNSPIRRPRRCAGASSCTSACAIEVKARLRNPATNISATATG